MDVLNKENDFLNFLRNSTIYSVSAKKKFLGRNFSSSAYSQKFYDNMMAYCIVQLGHKSKSWAFSPIKVIVTCSCFISPQSPQVSGLKEERTASISGLM